MHTIPARKYIQISLLVALAGSFLCWELGFAPSLAAQERFRSEAWNFNSRASLRDLEQKSAAQRYSAALGIFFQEVGRSSKHIEAAIAAMESVYAEARSKVRTERGRRELAIYESMLGWFSMGLAETVADERRKEYAAGKGLRYLDALLREHSENFDVLFIYVRSTWFVPTNYEDLTKDLKYAGEQFLAGTDSKPRNELGQVQRNVVLIALANTAIEENDFDTARNYFRQVDARSLRSLSTYGCARLEEVYQEIDGLLQNRRSGRRLRTKW